MHGDIFYWSGLGVERAANVRQDTQKAAGESCVVLDGARKKYINKKTNFAWTVHADIFAWYDSSDFAWSVIVGV